MKTFYRDAEVCSRVNESVGIQEDVRQKIVLSPRLFNLYYMDGVIRYLKAKVSGWN